MKRKHWLWAAVAAVVVIAGGYYFFGQKIVPPAALPPVTVKAMIIKSQDTPLTLDFIGQVQAFHEVEIRPQVAGFITEKFIDGGQLVKKGQLLYRIDPRQYNLNLLTAQAGLADSEAALANGQSNYQRSKSLYEASAISIQEFQNATTKLEQQKANVEVAKSKVGMAQIDLRFTDIYSPIDGHLDTKVLEPGSYVSLGQTVLAKISAYNTMLVSFSLSESEYLKLFGKPDDGDSGLEKVRLVLEDGTVYPEEGIVTQMESGLTQGTGALNFKAVFPNPDGMLLPGMFAKIRVVVEVRKNAILIPQRAITDLLGKKMVTVVLGDKTTEQRVIKVGAQLGNLSLVDSGLKAGDVLVVEGGQKVAPDQTVKAEMLTLEAFTSQAAR